MARTYQTPSRIPVITSGAVTTSSNSGNLKNTAGAIPLCDAVTLILDVTAHAQTTPTPILLIYLDDSPDGGTTWYPKLAFAKITTSTDIQRWEGKFIGAHPSESAALIRIGTTLATTSTSTTDLILAPDHRIRWEFTTNATATTATFAVWALCVQTGTYSV